MTTAANIGYPRIGPKRELKTALESYWRGDSDRSALEATAKQLRRQAWRTQQQAGLSQIPSNDFSFYDQVLDTACMVGAVPDRFGWSGDSVDLDTYFAMARGIQEQGRDAPAMEMTKWFDTNYHYIVPELSEGQRFRWASRKPVDEFEEAKAEGVHTRPVLVGPVTFLRLAKGQGGFDPLQLLDSLLPVYAEVLRALQDAGADWVQIDEPVLALDPDDQVQRSLQRAYDGLAGEVPGLKLLLATYFESLPQANLETAAKLPVAGLHLDLVSGKPQLDAALATLPESMTLSLGLIDGRNVWRTDLDAKLDQVERAVRRRGGDQVQVAPSCSLLHVPYDVEAETKLDAEFKSWLAFGRQKLDEVAALATGAADGREAIADTLERTRAALESRRSSTRIHNDRVKQRERAVSRDMMQRRSRFAERRQRQVAARALPALPTTTIGSFPQTREVRRARAEYRRGDRTNESYQQFLQQEIEQAVRMQERLGLDVLVHGEFERNDMVEFFGEQLSGFAFTTSAWVQSFGSRCVKPPIVYGDVERPAPMTVDWTKYAQSLTDKPVKGMLTGPLTIMKWSFERDDQAPETTCRQIALAIRDEVADLESGGIGLIQIDEPAFREGLPLHREDWDDYRRWAVECFRLASCAVGDETQIHTHMCYSEFNDIIESIAALDADVISIETSRSHMELLDAFIDYRYPNEIGPGIYDIHSPRVPERGEMVELLDKAMQRLDARQIWVNPDCGLKTRAWPETEAALGQMVQAARDARKRLDPAA